MFDNRNYCSASTVLSPQHHTAPSVGSNATQYSAVPVAVTGRSSGVAAISAGGDHTCAVTTGGIGKCWGWDLNGQLGINSQNQYLAPVSVVEP